jgi:hypothetical protein
MKTIVVSLIVLYLAFLAIGAGGAWHIVFSLIIF